MLRPNHGECDDVLAVIHDGVCCFREAVADVDDCSKEADALHFPTELEQYLDQLPAQVERLQHALMRQDLDALEMLVRQVKQSAGSHGFVAISQCASQVGRQLETSEAVDRVDDALSHLSDLCLRAAGASGDGPDGDLPPTAG